MEQLELDLEELMCRHEFEDDGDNFAIVCTKCGYSALVEFDDTLADKTNQEIFEYWQKEYNLT